ncbi:MAG: hypothetical protein AAF570_05970, partial [Bacteroidota bacterium]
MRRGFQTYSTRLIWALLLLCGAYALLPAQSPELNLLKYWRHRHQLTGDGTPDNPGFVTLPEDPRNEPGSVIPVAALFPWIDCQFDWLFGQSRQRCGITETGNGGVQGGADGTIRLGWLMVALASEYELLDQTNQTEKRLSTARDIWKCLEAYERLDSTAETKYGLPGVVDGFFIRNDMEFGYQFLPDKNGNPNFPGFSCLESSVECNRHREGTDAYSNVPSADQIIHLLIGASMIKSALAPGEVRINGEDLRVKAQRMAHLIVSRLAAHHWYIRSPHLTKVPVGPQNWIYSYPLAEAANRITENNTDLGFEKNYHNGISKTLGALCWKWIKDFFPTIPPWEVCFSDAPAGLQALAIRLSDQVDTGNIDDICWNPKNVVSLTQIMGLATISGTWEPEQLAYVAYTNGVEIYDLLRCVFHGGTPDPDVNRRARNLIDRAPCEKFCWIQPPDQNPISYHFTNAGQFYCDNIWEWRTNSRWVHPPDAEGNDDNLGSKWSPGIDFLSLYNVYHIVN